MNFLAILQALTPLLGPLLQLAVPKLKPAAIPSIVAGVATAEQLAIPGIDKKAVAIGVAQAGIQAAAAAGAPIQNVDTVVADVPLAVQLTVDIVNAVHKHPTVTTHAAAVQAAMTAAGN